MSPETRFPSTCNLDVVGIGNAIVDVLVQTDDSFISDNGLQKGGMALINEQQAETLYKASGPGLETSGGSVANTMVGIAQLGGRAGFIGRVRDDQLGTIFSHDIRSVGARFETPAASSGATTARCLIYVTPDAERTMCTFLGASTPLEPELQLDEIGPFRRRPHKSQPTSSWTLSRHLGAALASKEGVPAFVGVTGRGRGSDGSGESEE